MTIKHKVGIIAMLGFASLASALEPIKIGVTGPFSGPSAPMGQSMLAGVRLAVEEMNLGGGIKGRMIEIVERDDKADPATAKQIVEELIQKEKVVAGLGFVNTGVALAAQKLYQDARIPVINNVATGVTITQQFIPPTYADNYIFRNSAMDTIQSQMIVREALEKRKFTKLAIFHDTTPYGDQGRQLLTTQLGKFNVIPVDIQGFKLGVTDLSAQLKHAREAGAEAILTYGIGPELAVIANGSAKMGWKVPLIGSWTLSLPNFIEAAGRNGEGARMPQTFIEEPNNYRRNSFISAYHSATKTKRIPSAVSAAQGYDSALLIIGALNQASGTDGPALRAALENLQKPVYGVITTYDHPFTHDDHEAFSENMVVMGEVRNGRITFAYADDERRSLMVNKKRPSQAAGK
jgi:branched-chain amino acid transport system substrate-binding protein